MFLSKIVLKDFKGIDNLALSFTDAEGRIRKQTLLLGQNGTGKSNVLKAIALVTSGSEAVIDLLSDPDEWVRYGRNEAVLSATLVTQKGQERNITLVIRAGVSREELIRQNHESLQDLQRALMHTGRNYFVAGYGASRRASRGGSFTSSRERHNISGRVAAIYTLFNPDAQLNSLSSWAMSLDYRSGGKDLAIVRNTLNYFLEGVKFHGIDKERKTLLFKEGRNIIPLEALSDGYQNMAAWVGDLLYRLTDSFNNYRSPLKARGLLLIDEIDLHLHPRWQRRLLDFIGERLPNMQVVATTHSPLTAQQAGEDELYALRRENGRTELIPFVGDPRKLLVHQLLMSPVFGLETDESREVERMKNEFKTLSGLKRKNSAQRNRAASLRDSLEKLPETSYSNSFLDAQEMSMMKEVRKLLKNK